MEEVKKRQITVVIAVIINEKDQIFFTQRSDPGSPYDQKWELPGGKIEHGELPTEALIREIKEETGYLVRIEQLLPIETAMHAFDLQVIMIPYLCSIVEGSFSAEDKKILDGKFMTIEEMKDHEFLPRDTEIAISALAAHKHLKS